MLVCRYTNNLLFTYRVLICQMLDNKVCVHVSVCVQLSMSFTDSLPTDRWTLDRVSDSSYTVCVGGGGGGIVHGVMPMLLDLNLF